MCLDSFVLPRFEPLPGLQSNSRGARQRARRKLASINFAKDAVSSLASLAKGDTAQEFVPRSTTSLECYEEIRKETNQFSKQVSPQSVSHEETRAFLQRLIGPQASPYGGAERGEPVAAEVDRIDLPDEVVSFQSFEEFPFSKVEELLARNDYFPTEKEKSMSYADPSLRGRGAGRGDGLERLAVRLLEAGVCVATRRHKLLSSEDGLSVFTVSKGKDVYQNQRLVWDCRAINTKFRAPPKFKLGSLTALAEAEFPDSQFLSIASTDVQTMFYNVLLPPDAASLLFLKGVDVRHVRELLKSRGNFELAAKIPTPRQGSHCEDEDVVIGMRVLPMGWAWSPFLAQLFTERTVEEAVPGAVSLLHGTEFAEISEKSGAVMPYLDDVSAFSLGSTPAAAARRALDSLDRIKEKFSEKGMTCHKDASLDESVAKSLDMLGCEIIRRTKTEKCGNRVELDKCCEMNIYAQKPASRQPGASPPKCARDYETVIRPQPKKLRILVAATREIVKRKRLRTKILQSVVGLWSFYLQLRRPLYSVFESIYQHTLSVEKFVFLDSRARSELTTLANLAPLMFATVNLGVEPVVFMTDGCQFGAACCMRKLALPPGRASLRGSEVSKGHIRDYRMISQFRFADPPPTNQVLREAAGVLLAVKRCRRTSRAFTIFSDSSAVIGAMKKGRSSSRKLNRFLRQFCARALHRKQRFDMRFVPGIENYADGPSRGLRYPAVPPNRHE